MLLFHVGGSLFLDPHGFRQADLTFDIYFLRFIQLFQVIDLLFVILGWSKGTIVGGFFQILGRNIVALYFMTPEVDNLKLAWVMVIWSMAEVNRYLYYTFKTNPITGFLRYNSFMVLYPVGVAGEMFVINNFIYLHAETLSELEINFFRFVQGCIILGMVLLYAHMLKSRAKYYRSLKQAKPEESERVKSPLRSSKRD